MDFAKVTFEIVPLIELSDYVKLMANVFQR